MDKLLTNKYFCLALIAALGLVAFMYNRKGGCDMERMQMIDLIPSTPSIFQRAWSEIPAVPTVSSPVSTQANPFVPAISDLSEVNGPFDQKADMYIEEKLRREGYKSSKPLKSLDASFKKYMLDSDSVPFGSDMESEDRPRGRSATEHQNHPARSFSRIPMANDTRPDLSQCQPCNDRRPFSYKLL